MMMTSFSKSKRRVQNLKPLNTRTGEYEKQSICWVHHVALRRWNNLELSGVMWLVNDPPPLPDGHRLTRIKVRSGAGLQGEMKKKWVFWWWPHCSGCDKKTQQIIVNYVEEKRIKKTWCEYWDVSPPPHPQRNQLSRVSKLERQRI